MEYRNNIKVNIPKIEDFEYIPAKYLEELVTTGRTKIHSLDWLENYWYSFRLYFGNEWIYTINNVHGYYQVKVIGHRKAIK